MSNEGTKYCLDCILPDELVMPASERAISENPTNRAAISFTPGLGVGPLPPPRLAALTSKKWGNGRTLTVSFMDGDPQIQARLQPFAHQWSQYANIYLDFVEDPNANLRISFRYPGSWSYIGTDALSIPANQPTMNYGWLTRTTSDEEYSRVVIHEFGHALGCIHEHQNPTTDIPWNREAVYRFYAGPPNNWTREQVDVNLFQRYSQDVTQFSQFDPKSIMLYAIPKELLTDPAAEVGWNRELSETDKSFVGTMYPKEQKVYVDLSVNARSRVASIGQHGEEDLYRFIADQPGVYRIETRGWTNVVMSLFGPDDWSWQIAQDDDSGFLYNARIVADLEPGTYFVNVRHYRPTGTGRYYIRVRRER